jgi:eukaryotic-like serine/threonine-protein kinase
VRASLSRRLVTVMLLLGVLVLSIPAVTLAAGGGGSAGDQQYTDPFAGSSTPTTATHTSTATQTVTQQPTTSTPPPSTVAQTTGTLATTDPMTTPTATTASTELPYTGYDSWLAGAVGFALVGGGLALRHRVRQS